MKRRHFLLSCTCALMSPLPGCGAVLTPPKTICARRERRWPRYNTYSKDSRWGKTDLTYYMLDRDISDMKSAEWDKVWVQSFASWSKVSPVKFHPVNQWKRADIVIDVNKTAQGFGGKGSILAWAQMPTHADWNRQLWTQFDEAEDWVVERQDADDTVLQTVAVHEIGHLLGLRHSPHKSAVMYPHVTSDLMLTPQEHDIKAIQALYGE